MRALFRLENFPPNMLHPAVLIECPRMLFPFARQILAEATRQGGFPPLMLDPIDFAGMYQKRMAQQSSGERLRFMLVRPAQPDCPFAKLGDKFGMGVSVRHR